MSLPLEDKDRGNDYTGGNVKTTTATGMKSDRFAPVEPVFFLYFLSTLSGIPIIQQFVYYRISVSYGLPGISFGNETVCNKSLNASSPIRELELKAQQESSAWMLYLALAGAIPALITIPLYGAFCDRVGRKLTILFTIVGHILYLINCMVVVYADYDVQYLLIGALVLGVFGYYGAIGVGANSYIADTIPKEALSFRLAVLGGATGLAGIVSNIGIGLWIRVSGGFFYPLFLPFGAQVLNMCYVIVLLQETAPLNTDLNQEKFTTILLTYITKTFSLYFKSEQNVGKLRIVIISFILTAIVDDAKADVQSLYQMNSPLCWNSISIGYFNAITSFTFCILTMIGIKLLSNRLRDVHMAVLSCSFKIASLILEAFATTDVLMYLVPVVGFFAFTAPLQKSMLSKLVSPTEQGAVMSSVAFSEVVCALCGSLMFNNIYSATLSFLPGFVFLFMAALVVIGVLFLLIYWYMENESVRSYRNLYEEVAD